MWFPIGGPLEPCVYLTPLRKYLTLKILGSRQKSKLWLFEVTWRHRSRDYRTRCGHFSINSQWWPCIYLAQIRRYGVSKILGSRVWFFGLGLGLALGLKSSVTRPLDSAHVGGPIGGPLKPSVYLAPLRKYCVSKIIRSRVWPFGVTWRHRSHNRSTRHMWFSISGPLEPCVYLAPLRRYKASSLHLPMLKAKSSVRMRRVTWPEGRRSKITTYLEFPSPHCLFTIQPLWS